MAFEIYNGVLDSNLTTNQIIDKAIEMWDFDSVDQTSTLHSATYGNVKIGCDSGNTHFGVEIYTNVTGSKQYMAVDGSYRYTLVKSDNALLISMEGSSSWETIVIGNTTGTDGVKGKGGFYANSNANSAIYIGTDNWSSGASAAFTDTCKTTDGLTQLVPIAAPYGGFYFDNAYRVHMAQATGNKGLYVVDGDSDGSRYYISHRTAIKEE